MSKKPAYNAVIRQVLVAIDPLSDTERVALLAAALAVKIHNAPLGTALPLKTVAQKLADAIDAHTARTAAFQAQFRGAAP